MARGAIATGERIGGIRGFAWPVVVARSGVDGGFADAGFRWLVPSCGGAGTSGVRGGSRAGGRRGEVVALLSGSGVVVVVVVVVRRRCNGVGHALACALRLGEPEATGGIDGGGGTL